MRRPLIFVFFILFYVVSFAAIAASPIPNAKTPQKKQMTQEEWIAQQMEEHQKDMDQLFDGFLMDDPFESLQKMRERMERAFGRGDFDQSFRQSLFGMAMPEAWITSREEAGHDVYEIDSRKVDKEKLEINIQNGMLTIKAQGKNETPKGQGLETVSEMQQSFSLPEGVKDSDVKIEEKDHLIIIKVPKWNDQNNSPKSKLPTIQRPAPKNPPDDERIPLAPPSDKKFEL